MNIGFISTRLEGTDGVSLEAFKWSAVLSEMGHECFYFAGELDRPADRSRLVPEAHFTHPRVARINQDLFEDYTRSTRTTAAIHDLWRTLERELHAFIREFEIDLIIPENSLSLPMNVPLGLALTSLIAETAIPTIAHHHDFYWQRPRYQIHAAADYLQAAFPPVMPGIYNVVINTYAATELARRTGMRSTVVPNVMDFDHPPAPLDDYARTIRSTLGIDPDEKFLLQPTRIVPRKRIERSIELASRLDIPCALVVTHASGDEGDEYLRYLQGVTERLGVHTIFAAGRFDQHRGVMADGGPIFSLGDAYQQADLVTYPSIVEGFGNAFIEAVYYRRPIVMSGYEIFTIDIKPKGFEVLSMGEFTSDATVDAVRRVLAEPQRAESMTALNYRLGQRYYSFTSLRRRLQILIDHLLGTLY